MKRVKFLPLILLLIVSCSLSFSQRIDSLKTDREVLAFVRSIDSVHKILFIVRPKPVMQESLYNEQLKQNQIVAWQKADFDNNGRTDLLFNGFFDNYAGNHYAGEVYLERLRYKMDSTTSRRIYGILKQINFPHLKESYAVSWTDDVEGNLKITYNKGKIKKITDYGLIGTYGLAAVEEILINMEKDIGKK